MKWTTERPTVEGWYWWDSMLEGENPEIVWVSFHPPMPYVFYITGRREEFERFPYSKVGRWCPIPPPEE